MGDLDDFPSENPSESTQTTAEAAFEAAILKVKHLFAVQQRDRRDYGSDYQLELIDRQHRTNYRLHVQLKGTTQNARDDGSQRIRVDRTNLNYLLSQPSSIYVCYSLTTGRLQYRFAEDVYSETIARSRIGTTEKIQKTVTVRLVDPLDDDAFSWMHRTILANRKADRDFRMRWKVEAPVSIRTLLTESARSITVPANRVEAKSLLNQLRELGEDATISSAFAQFKTVLDGDWDAIADLYFAEIDLASNNHQFSRERVLEAISFLDKSRHRRSTHQGSILYCLGNAYSAIDLHQQAVVEYNAALELLDSPKYSALIACCLKNLGSSLEKLEQFDAAKSSYERAIATNGNHADAHFALAQWHWRFDKDWNSALGHIDQVYQKTRHSAVTNRHINGLRAECLFQTGNVSEAFRLIWELVTTEKSGGWEWDWCARLVSEHGLKSEEAGKHALAFWSRYSQHCSSDKRALDEKFRCMLFLGELTGTTNISYADLTALGTQVIAYGTSEAAWVWDQLGHSAQLRGDWIEAERAFSKAAREAPERCTFCHAVALNELGQYAQAHELLLQHVNRRVNDERAWFQIGFARDRLGDFGGAITAYEKAFGLDDTYSEALFNLGGAWWNAGEHLHAIQVWKDAIKRFPTDELAERLRNDLPRFFG